ncbi:MAG: hypothetical protein HYX27_13935 [Acidobacteria bacterium]|nr:hypothetical protein [Acidobacteriota bacterium]
MPLLADIRVKSTITAAGSTTESTVYTKGPRQRLEYGADATLIQQCDRKRLLQLDTAISTFQTIETTAPPPVDPQQLKGGPVSVKTILTDTGETKMMFGYKARHIKSVVTRTPSAEACDKTSSTVETDGWYIDLPGATLACTLEPAAPTASACQDQIKPELQGKAKLGYPLAYAITTRTGDAKAETISMQVLELEIKDLPDALFDTPQGWTDAKAKKAGITRIAVAPVNDKTGPGGPAYTQRIFKDLGLAKVETVQLNPGTQPEQLARARASEADFVLVAEVAEVKKPDPKAAAGSGAKRFGGMLSKATNLVNPKEAWEARIDYRLLSPADGAVLFTSSASGKTGGNTFNVRGAINLATTVGSMMVLGPMGANMMRGNLGNMLTQMNGNGGLFANGAMGPGAMNGMSPAAGAVGPSLSGMRMLAFAQSANAAPAPAGNATGESEQSKAVDSAIGEMLKGVLAQTKK